MPRHLFNVRGSVSVAKIMIEGSRLKKNDLDVIVLSVCYNVLSIELYDLKKKTPFYLYSIFAVCDSQLFFSREYIILYLYIRLRLKL